MFNYGEAKSNSVVSTNEFYVMEGGRVPPLTLQLMFGDRQIEVMKFDCVGFQPHLTWIKYIKLSRPNSSYKMYFQIIKFKEKKI